MPRRLHGRTVLITGAASGIGRATALRAVGEGAAIAAIDVDGTGLDALAEAVEGESGTIWTRVADVGRRDELIGAVAGLAAGAGALHGVFANAAILPPPVAADALDWQEWDRVLEVNLTGALATLVAALPFVPDGGSLLVSGSSMAIRPRDRRLAYVAAKAGLHAAARALAIELADRRIRVNVLAPGLTDTPMVHSIPGHVDGGLPSVPLGELVPPEEVAALAVHLLSDDALHMTGAVVSIDGGRTAG